MAHPFKGRHKLDTAFLGKVFLSVSALSTHKGRVRQEKNKYKPSINWTLYTVGLQAG